MGSLVIQHEHAQSCKLKPSTLFFSAAYLIIDCVGSKFHRFHEVVLVFLLSHSCALKSICGSHFVLLHMVGCMRIMSGLSKRWLHSFMYNFGKPQVIGQCCACGVHCGVGGQLRDGCEVQCT